jgi:FtsP/CotA-like multicopper oxidase with cupredoxin domain
MQHRTETAPPDHFPTDTTGLPACRRPEIVELADGAALALEIAPVAKQLGDATVRMLSYNGSIPGPTLKVAQGSEVEVNVINRGDLEATVHWHGLRLENRYDGTHQTQAPIPVGESFPSRVTFPDPGVYWYHPHIREDYGQEMGLYGNVLVVPADPEYWPPVHREILLTLDDVLIENGTVAPFSRSETTHTAMGRFGNVLLVGGEPDLALNARLGEVVRFYLTNTANTRVFKVKLPGARMKLVGGDSGRCEREEFVEEVVLAPSERIVIDVLFDVPGPLALEHHTPDRVYPLAAITVTGEPAALSLGREFEVLRSDPELTAERHGLARYLEAAPDRTLAFVAEMDFDAPDGGVDGPVVYTCPMHPAVITDEPGRCPDCGMKLLPAAMVDAYEHCDDDRHDGAAGHGDGHAHEAAGGIEWEDDMVEINKITTPANMRWKLIDRTTGAENQAIAWQFKVGDRVKIRLVNEMDSDHPMHHPFHIHGAGRFLILARDEVVEPNLVWSDTVLVRTGETVDILLDVTNPGLWMAHCHIAEHHESGMMFSFDVAEAEGAS